MTEKEQSLHGRLEAAANRRIPIHTTETLRTQYRMSAAQVHQALARHSRPVSIPGVLAGAARPEGALMIFVRERDQGYQVQLLEGIRGAK